MLIAALADEVGFATHLTRTAGKTGFELGGKIGASALGFPLSEPIALIGSALGMAKLERAAKHERWSKGNSDAGSADTSVAAFIDEHIWPAKARLVLRAAIEGTFCRDVCEVSLHLALYGIATAGGFEHMQKVEGGAQERQLSRGAGNLVAHLAGQLKHAVRLDSVVRRVEQDAQGVRVHSQLSAIRAQRVVLAIPPPLVSQLEFDPPLAASRLHALQQTQMGNVIKYGIVYPSAFWRKRRLSGTFWSSSGPVNVCYDTTPPGADVGVLSALSVAQSAEEMRSLQPEQRRKKILEAVALHLGELSRSPTDYFELVWNDEPLSGGGYSITTPAGGFTGGPKMLRQAVGRIHFAGSETATVCPGYMEGAIESAERVVNEMETGD